MIKAIKPFVLMMALTTSLSASATEKMYGVVGLGYADAEVGTTLKDDISYRLAIGHEFARQWNIELGYQKLVDKDPSGFGEGLTADMLSVSALGKAASPEGELFYRIGAANIDIKGQSYLNAENGCDLGDLRVGTQFSACAFDEGVFAGIFGLGFDFFISQKAMVRIEAEYIKGNESFEATAYYVGLRYNFN